MVKYENFSNEVSLRCSKSKLNGSKMFGEVSRPVIYICDLPYYKHSFWE